MADITELLEEHAHYLDGYIGFVGSPDAIVRTLRNGKAEIERLRHDIERYIAIASEAADEIEQLRARVAELESHLLSQKSNPLRASQNDTPEGDADTSNRAYRGA